MVRVIRRRCYLWMVSVVHHQCHPWAVSECPQRWESWCMGRHQVQDRFCSPTTEQSDLLTKAVLSLDVVQCTTTGWQWYWCYSIQIVMVDTHWWAGWRQDHLVYPSAGRRLQQVCWWRLLLPGCGRACTITRAVTDSFNKGGCFLYSTVLSTTSTAVWTRSSIDRCSYQTTSSEMASKKAVTVTRHSGLPERCISHWSIMSLKIQLTGASIQHHHRDI